MENIKLGGSFFCPRCQCTHSSAITCDEVRKMKQRNEEFWANLRKTTEEEKAMQTQPLFTLTAEELTIVEHFLTCDKMQLETYEPSQENDMMIGDLNHILNKIKDYQNGH